MKRTIIIAALCALSLPAFAQSAPSAADLRDLSFRLNAYKKTGVSEEMGGISLMEALRIEADAILAIDRSLKRIEADRIHTPTTLNGDCNVVGDHNTNCNK